MARVSVQPKAEEEGTASNDRERMVEKMVGTARF